MSGTLLPLKQDNETKSKKADSRCFGTQHVSACCIALRKVFGNPKTLLTRTFICHSSLQVLLILSTRIRCYDGSNKGTRKQRQACISASEGLSWIYELTFQVTSKQVIVGSGVPWVRH